MSTPVPALSATPIIQGSVVQPTKVIGPKAATVAELGEVLKHLITRSGIYHDEGKQTAALNTVSKFQKAFSEGSVDVREEHMAQREDVSKRVAPGGAISVPVGIPQIDYTALARAMLAVQQEQAQLSQQGGN